MLIPIAEIFTSIQGEGHYQGTPMTFIRLAGCNVGRNEPGEEQGWHPICTTFDGRQFACDTDYRRKQWMTEAEILSQIPRDMRHVCLTGGEPFLHQEAVVDLCLTLTSLEVLPHIETSGTQPISHEFLTKNCWITCSPKQGFLSENAGKVDEWKFLISEWSQVPAIKRFLAEHNADDGAKVFLQPINMVGGLDMANVAVVHEVLQGNPNWRLSLQLHKILGVR